MTLPDFANLTIGQIAGYLIPLALLVAVAGIGRAIASRTVLWTYVGEWLTSWALGALVLIAVAIVARGIPGLSEPNDAVGLVFVPAVAAYVTAALAAIAKALGVDLSRLPFSSNVETKFRPSQVRASASDTPALPAAVAPAVTPAAPRRRAPTGPTS